MAREVLGRRTFLGSSVTAALGGAVLGSGALRGLRHGLLPAGRAALTSVTALSGAPNPLAAPLDPPQVRSFVSRSDLAVPGVAVTRAEGWSPANVPGTFFLTPRGPSAESGLMIVDRDGDLVWYQDMRNADFSPWNFQVQTYQGRPTLTWFQGILDLEGFGAGGHYKIYDSSYREVASFEAVRYPSDLHELNLTSEGTALVTAYEVTKTGFVIGHAQEIDVATGQLVFDWACYPAVPASDTYVSSNATNDYFHINSVDIWPGSARNLLISSRNTCCVYLVDRQTKEIIWRLHGKQSSWATNPRSQFWYQHHARALPDGSGISVFDDASQAETPSPEKQSAGKVIRLYPASGLALCERLFRHTDSHIDVIAEGSTQLLPNGTAVIGWGASPYLSVFSYEPSQFEGSLVLDARLPDGWTSYRGFAFDWNGSPAESEMALAVLPGVSSGQFVAFMSWNGATDVAAWQVEASTGGGTPNQVALVPRTGFETSAAFTADGATQFSAVAYDAFGKVLGTTRSVTAAS